MKPTRIASLIVGLLLGLAGLGLLAGGATLAWALGTQRDDAGYFNADRQRFETETFALTSDDIDLRDMGAGGTDNWANATVRVAAQSATGDDVFVGIARVDEIENYLAGVPHDRVTSAGDQDVCWMPGCTSRAMFGPDYRRENTDGTSSPTPPMTETFWAATATGTGTQDLIWSVEEGKWAIVVMNVDGARAVLADVQVGGRVDYLVPISIGLLIAAVFMLGAGVTLTVIGVTGGHTRNAPPPQLPSSSTPFAPPTAASPALSE